MIIDNTSLMYEWLNPQFNYDRHFGWYFLDILGNLKIKLWIYTYIKHSYQLVVWGNETLKCKNQWISIPLIVCKNQLN